MDVLSKALAAVVLLGLSIGAASAQTAPTVNKTWVSSTGTDSGSCQLVAPCKSFAYAISETNPGGEIDVKDSGAYGAFTADKAITIVAAGVVASVGLGSNNAAISITAASGVTVDIVGLTLNTHSLSEGIGLMANCNCVVTLDHMNIQGNKVGILVVSGATPNILITNSHFSTNFIGIVNQSSGNVYVGQSSISGNSIGISGNIMSYKNNEINANKIADSQSGVITAIAPE